MLTRNKGYLQGKMQLFGYFLCVDLSTMLLFEIIGDSPGFEQNSGCHMVFAFFLQWTKAECSLLLSVYKIIFYLKGMWKACFPPSKYTCFFE